MKCAESSNGIILGPIQNVCVAAMTVWWLAEKESYGQLFFPPAYPGGPLGVLHLHQNRICMFCFQLEKVESFGSSPALFSLGQEPNLKSPAFPHPSPHLLIFIFEAFPLVSPTHPVFLRLPSSPCTAPTAPCASLILPCQTLTTIILVL